MSFAPSRSLRRPAVAGLFYPADPQQCGQLAAGYVRTLSSFADSPEPTSSARWIGAVVPHAGWICSGAIAGHAIGAVRDSLRAAGSRDGASGQTLTDGAGECVGEDSDVVIDVVIVFGAVHTPLPLDAAVLATHDAWSVPTGTSRVPVELSRKLSEASDVIGAGVSAGVYGIDDRFHDREHAVEVELPLIQQAWPDARVLPVEVPLMEDAVKVGIRAACAVQAEKLRAVYLASSDLTHYGPAYQFAPVGVGIDALAWAKDNDRSLLSVVTELRVEQVVPEVRQRQNACGGGAIAAMLAACREHGANRASVLRHANSYEVLREVAPQRPDNAVGYAAVVVGN